MSNISKLSKSKLEAALLRGKGHRKPSQSLKQQVKSVKTSSFKERMGVKEGGRRLSASANAANRAKLLNPMHPTLFFRLSSGFNRHLKPFLLKILVLGLFCFTSWKLYPVIYKYYRWCVYS
jgi:hypothetical protein